MRPNEHSKDYLHSLDGWRALAVLLVLFGHAPRMPSVFQYLQFGAGLGVRIFFAISGLLICTRLLDEEAKRGRISIRNFYLRRAFRILPASSVYLLTLVVLGALAVVPFELPSWSAGLLFYRNYYSYIKGVNSAGWFTSHFWSLSVEEHFYFLLPSVVLFFPRFRSWILGGLSIVSFGWACVYVLRAGKDVNPLWEQRTEFSLCLLLMPALFAIYLRHPAVRQAATRVLLPWVGIACGLLCVTRFVHPFGPLSQNELFGTGCKAVLFPLMLLSTILHPHSWLTHLLELAPVRFVGRISYSLYLWQSLFLSPDFTYEHFPIHVFHNPFVGIGCTFVCAIASYYLVETPLIAFGRRFIKAHMVPTITVHGTPTPGEDLAAEVRS